MTSMNHNFLHKVKKILNEMKDFKSSPKYIVNKFHNETIHHNVHLPISREIKNLGFFVSSPKLKNGIANYDINSKYRGTDVLKQYLGIGNDIIPVPTHHPKQESTVKNIVERVFSKKPSKYLNYLKTLHAGLDNAIKQHKLEWEKSHVGATSSIREIKKSTINALQNKKAINSGDIEKYQADAHFYSEKAAEHERLIKELQNHKSSLIKHGRELKNIFGIDMQDNSIGNLNSPHIVGGVWDEIF